MTTFLGGRQPPSATDWADGGAPRASRRRASPRGARQTAADLDDESRIEIPIELKPDIAARIADHARAADLVVEAVMGVAVNPKRGAAPLDEVVEMG